MLRRPLQPVTRKTYEASCHCGAVRVRFDKRPARIVDCNCSICGRYGARWCYTNRAAIRVIAARPDIKAYRWGSKGIDFKHCRQCGCVVYYERRRPNIDGLTRVGINTRMMAAEDLVGIRVRYLDGANSWKYLD